MVKLLIIADDFTGALDTGIQFAKRGIDTQIFTGRRIQKEDITDSAQVVVVDTETRPLSGGQAYQIVKEVVEDAVKVCVPTILKKTDSALRGNVGAELEAVMDAAGEKSMYFIPAFPDMNRVTRSGIHYIDGELLEDSAFGMDPFEPVDCSYIPKLLSRQTGCRIEKVGINDEFPKTVFEDSTIYVFDAEKKEHIIQRTEELKEYQKTRLIAGCAGLAECLPTVLNLEEGERRTVQKQKGLYVACGSLNPITKEQIEYAFARGFSRLNLSPRQKLEENYYEKEEGQEFLENIRRICLRETRLITDTFDLEDDRATLSYVREHNIPETSVRYRISSSHGRIVKYLLEHGMEYTIMMTGGDTLMGLMKVMNCTQLYPVCEIEKGAVLSLLIWNGRKIQVISKSGGFGGKEIITRIAEKVIERQ